MSEPQAAAAPGWYADQAGAIRWWDGQAWGPLAPPPGPPPPPAPNKAVAVLAHLGPIVGGFILPLVLYLVTDERDRYTRHHASEGLNFCLTLLILQVGGFALFFVAIFAGAAASSASGSGAGAGLGFGLGFFAVWGVLMLVFVGAWVFAIIGAVQASKGVWYRYPICVRFVKGAAPAGTPPLVGF